MTFMTKKCKLSAKTKNRQLFNIFFSLSVKSEMI